LVDAGNTDKSTSNSSSSSSTIAVAVVLAVLVAILVGVVALQRRSLNEAREQKDRSAFGRSSGTRLSRLSLIITVTLIVIPCHL